MILTQHMFVSRLPDRFGATACHSARHQFLTETWGMRGFSSFGALIKTVASIREIKRTNSRSDRSRILNKRDHGQNEADVGPN